MNVCGSSAVLLLLLAGVLLFLLPHPLPQLLADIRKRVHLGGEGLYSAAEPAALCLPTIQGKHTFMFTGETNICHTDAAA